MQRIAKSEDKDAAFALRELAKTDPSALEAVAALVPPELANSHEDAEVVQTLLELLVEAIEAGHAKTALQPNVIAALMGLATHPEAQWVRLCALTALDSLAGTQLDATLEELLKVPSALEMLMQALEDPAVQVRNQAVLLLQRLSPHEQIKLFITFCDGFQALIRIAEEERGTPVAGDALAVAYNVLLGNLPGQRQFCESPLCSRGSWRS